MTTINANPVEQNRHPLGYATPPAPVSRAAWWTGWIISSILILMMGGMGAAMILFNRAMAVEGMTKYGYPARAAIPILIVMIACAVLYAIPRTAVLGAVLLTGYLGGAVATHVRVGEAFWMPVVVGVVIWLALVFRDSRLRMLMPLRSSR